MSYLSFILALVEFTSSYKDLPFYQGLDIYLDLVVHYELLFLKLSGIASIICLGVFLALLKYGKEGGERIGCYLLVFGVVWPVFEVITYFIATGLARSITPEGIADPVAFWLLVALMTLLGAG